MITGALKSQVDRIWDAFWSGGISNPITVIEQFTYLLFMRQLDERQAQAEFLANTLGGEPDDTQIFYDATHDHLRFSKLLAVDSPEARFAAFREGFDYIKQLGAARDSGFVTHMKDAAFLIPNPATLTTVATMIAKLEFSNKDMTGDLYEYMLSKLATAGTNGQFRTPSHIIELIVALTEPKVTDRLIDPACGTAGFLAATSEYLRDDFKNATKQQREHYLACGLTGFDFDSTMVRIAAMNMVMHGFSDPNISYLDSLQELAPERLEAFDVLLANPPFAGSINQDILDPELASIKTKKTELLFIARFLTLLKLGGRAAVVVPEGVLFGSTRAHKTLRKELVNNQKIDGIIKLPSGAFKPYTGVSTAIVCFTRTDSPGQNEHIWFYDITADGRSLDDKRSPLLAEELLGPWPATPLDDAQLRLNNLPDVVARFHNQTTERDRARTEASFTVPVDEIREADYDLSMNRYKEIVFETEETRDPQDILADIDALDAEIADAMSTLKGLI